MCSAFAAAGVTDSPTAATAATVEPATKPRGSRKSQRSSGSTPPPGGPRIIRPREAARRVGFSTTTLRRMEREGLFPQHIDLSPNAIAYVEDEVDAWLAEKIAARRA